MPVFRRPASSSSFTFGLVSQTNPDVMVRSGFGIRPRLIKPTLLLTMPQCATAPALSHCLSAASRIGTNLPNMQPMTTMNVVFGLIKPHLRRVVHDRRPENVHARQHAGVHDPLSAVVSHEHDIAEVLQEDAHQPADARNSMS